MSTRDLLRANDARFAAMATDLSAADWAAPSLCERWTNHEVLAHLVLGYGGRVAPVAAAMLRYRGSFDTANADLACVLAGRRTPAELLDDFSVLTARPQGMGRYFPRTLLLGDHVTHELDICHAIGRPAAVAPQALIAVLNAQVTLPNPFVPAYRNARGLRLTATDVNWTHGHAGPEVAGTAAELISALGSRPHTLDRLDGEGAAILATRVSRPSRRAV